MTQKRLEELLRYWQRRLRLRDWDVKVVLVRSYDIGRGRVAECEYEEVLKEAVIRVVDPADRPPSLWKQDLEADLVHELLHLHFAPFMADGDSNPRTWADQETAIEQIAQALVAARRDTHRFSWEPAGRHRRPGQDQT